MDEKLITVSSTPHIHSKDTVEKIMLDVIIALIPACAAGVYFFKLKALAVILVSVVSCVLFEFLYQKAVKKPVTVSDLSAVVTGILLAFNLPVSVPLWLPAVGAFVAIIIVKQLFGGIGQNFVNPALMGRAFLLTSYPALMTHWTVDSVTAATPLGLLKNGDIIVPSQTDYINAFWGNIGGCIGETCVVALVLGGVYLLIKKVITWRIPAAYIFTVFVLSYVFGRNGFFTGVPLYEVITGGLLLGAFFMATDYTTSPVTKTGHLIMGVGCGVLTVLIRVYGGYPEGVSYSVLLMNLTVPLIDKFTRPRVYGVTKKRAPGKGK
jgi:electron transport complex protein RnfD